MREQRLCLAYPGKVVGVDGDFARVDFGEGTIKEGVNVSLVQAQIGNYVLVHAGYAIQIVDEVEARQTLEYWRQILAADPRNRDGYEQQLKGGLG
jgi:hydrogenase expression/formation protein HypC